MGKFKIQKRTIKAYSQKGEGGKPHYDLATPPYSTLRAADRGTETKNLQKILLQVLHARPRHALFFFLGLTVLRCAKR